MPVRGSGIVGHRYSPVCSYVHYIGTYCCKGDAVIRIKSIFPHARPPQCPGQSNTSSKSETSRGVPSDKSRRYFGESMESIKGATVLRERGP